MKTIMSGVITAVLAFSTAMAMAQGPGAMNEGSGSSMAAGAQAEFGVFGSYWNPSDLHGAYGNGVELRMTKSKCYLTARVTRYDQFDDEGGIDRDLRVTPAEVGLGLQWAPCDSATLYTGAGASLFMMETEGPNPDTELGWFAEAGLNCRIWGNMYFFASTVWRDATATMDNNVALDVDRGKGIELDGLAFNAGLSFRGRCMQKKTAPASTNP